MRRFNRVTYDVSGKPLTVKFELSGESVNADRQHPEEPQAQKRALQRDRTGRVTAIRIVTDLTKLEQEQAQALQHLDTLLVHVPFGFAFLDLDLRFLRINEQLAEINGYSVAAHLGKTVAEILPSLATSLREVAARILATGQPVLNQELIGETARAPGIVRHWHASWYPVRDERGEITGFSAMVVDITERKQAQDALQLTNERFELAVKASQVVLFQQDLELRYRWIRNPAAGFDEEGHVGKRDVDLMERAEDAAYLEGLKQEVIRSGVGKRQDIFMHIQNTGRYFDLLVEPTRDAAGVISGVTCAAIDITERKHAQAKLRENERHFQALAEASLEVPYRMSADWSTMLPLDGRELVASSDRALTDWAWLEQNLPRDEHARVRQAISDAIAAKGLFELEHRVVRPDGSTGWTFSRAVPILDENKAVVAWFGAASDITQRKQADERLRLAIDSSDLGTWHWDIRTAELDWSERCLKIFGLPAGTAMSYEKFLGALHPEDRARADVAVRAALQDGSEYRIELRSIWPDGSMHWALSLGRAYCNAAGESTYMEGVAIDITQHRQVEAALHETERHYRALAEASSEIPYRMSADWSTMLPLNGRGLFESSDGALSQWAWMDHYLPSDEHVRVRQAIDHAIAEKTLFELEHRVLGADGSIVWVRSRAVPILDENQGLVTWFGAASDITERKQIELNLIAATAAAEKANRVKSDFLSGMSHELRTPLNSILGFAQLMEAAAPPPTPAQGRNLAQIIKGGWYLLELINELLDLAQIESGKLHIAQESVSLAEVMLECRAMIEPQASARAITMTFPSLEPPGFVRADRTRVKQVLINFLSNAIKYNKAPGAVTVEYALVAPDAIRVSVRDTGEGLAPEKLAQLFQPFNRLGKETGFEEGTGIGLVMSRRLVELMGGSIGVDSEVGVGSVFWFELKWESA